MRYLTILVFIFYLNSISAQEIPNDSILNQLKQKLENSEKYGVKKSIYTDIFENLNSTNKSDLLVYTEELQELAYHNKDNEGIAISKFYSAEYYYSINDFKNAVQLYNECLVLFKQLNNNKYLADIYHQLGRTYQYLNNYEESLKSYQKSIEVFEAIGNREEVAVNYHDIGTLYNDLEKYTLAYEYYNKALKIYNETENKERQAAILQNIGVLYNNWENYEQSLIFYKKSLKIYEDLKDKLNIAISYSNIGLVYEIKHDYYKALEYYQRALIMFEEVDYKPALVYIFYNLGSIYDNLKEIDKAEEYFNQGLMLSRKIGMLDYISYNYEALSENYEKRSNYRQALNYYKDFVEIKDSIFNESKMQQINEIEARFQNKQKQKEIEFLKLDQRLQEAELKKKEAQNLILIFSSFLTLVIAVILLLFNRFQKKSSLRLEKEVHNHRITEKKLNNLTQELEDRVKERTLELEKINIKLREEAHQHKKTLENLERAKNRAEEADKVKSKFLANISHEVRTPMNAITGFSQMLGREDLPTNKRINYINIIKDSCTSLTNLIDDIIDYASIESGEIAVEMKEFNPHPILEYLFDHYTNQLIKREKNNIKLAYANENVDPDLTINADPARFKQIMAVLIDNAIKFTENGIVEFGFVYPDNEHIEFFVKDTGIGIDKEFRELIFERFRQIDESSTKEYSGAGIGLSVAKHLVELHKGEIWFESTKGNGTTFYFKLPHMNENEESFEAVQFDTYNWENKLILVAEDKKINYEIIKETLLITNAELMWAKNGKEAIDIVNQTENIDLILMDIQMPVMDGYETTRRIKEMNKDITIIAQTAYALPKDSVKCFDAGCDDYIAKPISLNEFLKKLDKYLS